MKRRKSDARRRRGEGEMKRTRRVGRRNRAADERKRSGDGERKRRENRDDVCVCMCVI